MAALARRRRRAGRDVSRRHAGRLHAVVTHGAAIGDALMREHRARPGEGGVAGIAFEIGLDVGRALALRLYTVVAARAAAARLRVIEVDGRLPPDRRVAAVALVGGEDVVGGLGGGADRGAHAVTGGAQLRGALEDRVGGTGLDRQAAVVAHALET